MKRAELTRGFSLIEMLYWLTYGSFTTYLVAFVTDARGGSASVAGLMLALFMASACVGHIFFGSLCDRRQNNRSVFMATLTGIIVIQLGVYFAPNMILLGVGYVCLGFIQPPTSALMDTWLIRSFPDDPGAYSPIRALASLAYAVLMLVMGWTIEHIGHWMMPVLSTCFAVAGILVARSMPEIPVWRATPANPSPRSACARSRPWCGCSS
ncbi:MAG: MFS transporter [Clostridia bacterium]|nr:MFS transporter [Clostridia bacterium]